MADSNSPKAYELIGGAPVLRAIVHRFYEIMHTAPPYSALRNLHPEELGASEEKLFMFLSGWLGGPNLFVEKHGAPMLRARHLPFAINKNQRDMWMMCMVQAFEDNNVAEPIRSEVLHSMLNLADHMRNQKED